MRIFLSVPTPKSHLLIYFILNLWNQFRSKQTKKTNGSKKYSTPFFLFEIQSKALIIDKIEHKIIQ